MTKNPRISITLSPENHALLARLAVLQHRPLSSVLTDYLEVIWPVLASVADALETASRVQADKLAGLEGSIQRADAVFSELLSGLASLSEGEAS
jgi:hypothetical protein